MPYYGAGDYYQAGGYYQGDNYQAGGLGSFFKKALGAVGKVALGAAKLTPIGRGVATAIDIGQKVLRAGRPRLPAPPGFAPGSLEDLGGMDVDVPAETMVPTFSRCRRRIKLCPKRVGKGPDAPVIFAPCPKRMNVTNVRALRRAGRRVRGFLKVARKLGALPVSGGGGKKLFKKKAKK